ncbi:MAG: hypothetical protein ABIP94_14950 [Planctomycetota bacterium]
MLPSLVRRLDLRCTEGGGELLAWTGVVLFATALALLSHCVQPVRERRLKTFAEQALPEIGALLVWPGPPKSPTDLPTLPAPRRLTLDDGRAFAHANGALPAVLLGEPGQEWPVVDRAGSVVGRVRADEAKPSWRRLPDPIVSRRGNVYVQSGADAAITFVAATTARPRIACWPSCQHRADVLAPRANVQLRSLSGALRAMSANVNGSGNNRSSVVC